MNPASIYTTTLRSTALRSHKLLFAAFYLAGLLLLAGIGAFQAAPGYMDAEYYYSGTQFLVDGQGFYQPYLWNYLDQVKGLPSPSHTFWMPLVSVLGVPGYALFRTLTGARLLLWLLAAFIPPVTMLLGMKIHGRVDLAVVGGIFSLFPVYYTVYLPTTDSFGIYMLLGSLFFLVAGWGERSSPEVKSLLLGIIAGLMYMARADGLFWLAGGALWQFRGSVKGKLNLRSSWLQATLQSVIVAGAFLIVSSPWFLRNLIQMQTLLPTGNSRALWLTRYEDLFVFPADLLTPARWAAQGIPAILAGYGRAASANLQTMVAVQGSVVLLPFILVGVVVFRKIPVVILAVSLWASIAIVFTVLFPYQGMNGSFFHAGAAYQPLFWALAPPGIERVVNFVAGLRKWQRGKQVQRFVEVLLTVILVILSGAFFVQRTLGDQDQPAWNDSQERYARIEAGLQAAGANPCDLVMVNNPPGYFLASGRSSVVIPFGGVDMAQLAARAYGVRYLMLDESNSGHLAEIFLNPQDYPGLNYLRTIDGVRLYEFTQ